MRGISTHPPFPFTRFLSGRNESKKPLNRVFIAFNYDSSHNSATPSRVNHVERTTRVCSIFLFFSFFFISCKFVFVRSHGELSGGNTFVSKKFVQYVDSTYCEYFFLLFIIFMDLLGYLAPVDDIRARGFNGRYFLARLFCLWLVVLSRYLYDFLSLSFVLILLFYFYTAWYGIIYLIKYYQNS